MVVCLYYFDVKRHIEFNLSLYNYKKNNLPT